MRIIYKFPKQFIPRIKKMSSPLSNIAVSGLPSTSPSSHPSSPAKPALRTDIIYPRFGDFSGHPQAKMLTNICDAISELNLWSWVATFNPKENEGFMWSDAPEINQIGRHPKVESDGHSGASFAWCMRNMEIIIKKGWYKYHAEFIAPKTTNNNL